MEARTLPELLFKRAQKHGDRVAQMVVSRIADLPVIEVEELTSTERGAGGHGSTGD